MARLELRAAGDPAALTGPVRRLVAEVDPNLPLDDPRLLRDQVSRAFDSQRLAARFVSLFGAARVDAGVDRPLRHDRAERRTPHERDWRPHGARRGGRAGRLDDPAADRSCCSASASPSACRPRASPRASSPASCSACA